MLPYLHYYLQPGSNIDNTTTHTGTEAKAPCFKQHRADFYTHITKTKKKPISTRKSMNSTGL